ERERERVTGLLDEARDSRGGALVVHGPPGVGKSALLADGVAHAEGMQVLRTQGIESESPLAFAALQRLLRPAMRYAERLPAPQATALRAAFGEADDRATDRFLVFLAALSLLAEAAEEAPVLCVIDDAHWLDDASAAALLFVARRLGPERVALLFAARDGDLRRFDSGELPELTLGGLDVAAADRLLSERAGAPVSADVRDRLMAQTGGNPLALVELPVALTPGQLTGREQLPAQLPLTQGVQRVFLDRCRRLSPSAQTVLCVAAADDTTRVSVVRQAADVLGAGPAAFTEAEGSGLLRIVGAEIEFRHPLVRSAIYQGAATLTRQQAHGALARVMTGPQDADRRAWHLAAAVDEPDENVVAALDQAAGRAATRGGYEAASAAFERAAELTRDETARTVRLFAAATNAWLAAQLPRAMRLANDARVGATDPVLHADLDRLRGRIEFTVGSVPAGIRIWDQAARGVVATDPQRAREIGMLATAGSTFLPEPDRTDLDPAELLASPSQDTSSRARCFTNLLIGFHHLNHDGLAAATVSLREAITLGENLDDTDLFTNLGIATFHLGDDDGFRRCFTRLLTRSRDSGAIGLVLFALPRLAIADLSAGNWTGAVANATEAVQLARSTGQPALSAMPLAQLALYAALRGDADYESLITELGQVTTEQPAGILGVLVQDTQMWAQGSHAALTGQPAEALHHFEQMTQPTLTRLAAYDRLDVATRAGHLDTAARWLSDLERFADTVETPHARTVVAYGRALLAAKDSPATAEGFFQQALGDQPMGYQPGAARPFERARTHLAYGEFLRRSRRRVDAREQLRTALQMFDDLGATPWAQRAEQELRGSGETARKRDASTVVALTAQERQVAVFVAEGLSNREVAAKLFLSPRTIDFHLRNVFAKTGVTSRTGLARLEL
ncbi:MAG TPA: AAA family ATPase, partial [Nakamurella sp.]|nr:AAA family ATPase [Nakamurella sp.]